MCISEAEYTIILIGQICFVACVRGPLCNIYEATVQIELPSTAMLVNKSMAILAPVNTLQSCIKFYNIEQENIGNYFK